MLDKFYMDRKDNTDLNVYRFGIEDCLPNYNWGPALKDHYNIHYVFSGKGELVIQNTKYIVEKNQGFLIPPNTIVSYMADSQNPWSYCWVGFNGLKAEFYTNKLGLSINRPIYECKDGAEIISIIKNMLEAKDFKKGNELYLLGNLYLFIYYLLDNIASSSKTDELHSKKEEYIQSAIDYISKNYSMPITIQEIANHINIDRSYLFLLFKELLNISPKEYLINYRINVAIELLRNNNLSVGEISRSVGYNDQLLFSKIFKKFTGESPLKYRLKKLK